MSIEEKLDQVASHPDYERLWGGAYDGGDPDQLRNIYISFVSSYLLEDGLSASPGALDAMSKIYLAIADSTATQSPEEIVTAVGAPASAVPVIEVLSEHALAEPQEQLDALVPAVRAYLSAYGYSIDEEALEAIVLVEVALMRP